MPRSRSSPSPPASTLASGRGQSKKSASTHRVRRRRGSSVLDSKEPKEKPKTHDWSTSYHAGSSRCVLQNKIFDGIMLSCLRSSESRDSSDEDSEVEVLSDLRGRTGSDTPSQNEPARKKSTRNSSPPGASSSDSTTSGLKQSRAPFTRSRSPVVFKGTSRLHRRASPAPSRFSKLQPSMRFVLPAELSFRVQLPLLGTAWIFRADTRHMGEAALIICSIFYATRSLSDYPTPSIPYLSGQTPHLTLQIGKLCTRQSFL